MGRTPQDWFRALFRDTFRNFRDPKFMHAMLVLINRKTGLTRTRTCPNSKIFFGDADRLVPSLSLRSRECFFETGEPSRRQAPADVGSVRRGRARTPPPTA